MLTRITSSTRSKPSLGDQFWKDSANQKQFFDSIAIQLNIKHPQEWYKVRLSELEKRGAKHILSKHYEGSLYRALSAFYPNYHLEEWQLNKSSIDNWKEEDTRRKFFHWIAEDLGLPPLDTNSNNNTSNSNKSENDNLLLPWYNLTKEQVIELGGGVLLAKYYRGSVERALRSIFPQYSWLPSEFQRAEWRSNKSKQRQLMDDIAKRLGIQNREDWYSVKAGQVLGAGGAALKMFFGDSLIQTLQSVYPEYDWKPWQFAKVYPDYWSEATHQRKFLDSLSLENSSSSTPSSSSTSTTSNNNLHILRREDWYSIKMNTLPDKVQSLIVHHHESSLISALELVYPEYDWKPWQFGRVGQRFWQSEYNTKQYLEWLSDKLQLKNLDGMSFRVPILMSTYYYNISIMILILL